MILRGILLRKAEFITALRCLCHFEKKIRFSKPCLFHFKMAMTSVSYNSAIHCVFWFYVIVS